MYTVHVCVVDQHMATRLSCPICTYNTCTFILCLSKTVCTVYKMFVHIHVCDKDMGIAQFYTCIHLYMYVQCICLCAYKTVSSVLFTFMSSSICMECAILYPSFKGHDVHVHVFQQGT